jgi:hypothetical protein
MLWHCHDVQGALPWMHLDVQGVGCWRSLFEVVASILPHALAVLGLAHAEDFGYCFAARALATRTCN